MNSNINMNMNIYILYKLAAPRKGVYLNLATFFSSI